MKNTYDQKKNIKIRIRYCEQKKGCEERKMFSRKGRAVEKKILGITFNRDIVTSTKIIEEI